MKHFRTFISLIFFLSFSYAGQVPSLYDDKKKFSHTLLKEYIEWAEPCIKEYPPKYDSEDQKKRIFLSTLMITNEIKRMNVKEIDDPDLLINLGHVMAMGHNIDLGTAAHAKFLFEKALNIDKDNRSGNYLFGMFLISTTKYFFASEPYLQKAYELGEVDAIYSLGLLEARRGNKEKAIEKLNKYLTHKPNNKHTLQMIDNIKNGRYKFNDTPSKQYEYKITTPNKVNK